MRADVERCVKRILETRPGKRWSIAPGKTFAEFFAGIGLMRCALEKHGLAAADSGTVLQPMLDAAFIDIHALQREARDAGNIAIPFVRQLTVRGDDINVFAREFGKRPMIRWALRRAGVVVCLSEELKKAVLTLAGPQTNRRAADFSELRRWARRSPSRGEPRRIHLQRRGDALHR